MLIFIHPVLDSLLTGDSTEKITNGRESVARRGGLGVVTAAIFLAGEMAGSGVLALPAAMLGTGRSQTIYNGSEVHQVAQSVNLLLL